MGVGAAVVWKGEIVAERRARLAALSVLANFAGNFEASMMEALLALLTLLLVLASVT